jgi:prepilin-type N-terminal cleavage/methylation domain-containing protein
MKRQSTAKRAFTLIELITVIGLIVIITMVALPAFQDIGRGAKMQTAVFNLKNTLGLARQTAITRRRNIDVIFPDSFSHPFDEGQARYSQQSYAVFDRKEYAYLSQWFFLPEGVIFVRNKFAPKDDSRISPIGTPGFDNFFDVPREGYGSSYPPDTFDYTWTPFPTSTNDLLWFPAIVFDSRGRANIPGEDYAHATSYLPDYKAEYSNYSHDPTDLTLWPSGVTIYIGEGFIIYNDDKTNIKEFNFKSEDNVPILWAFGLHRFTGKAFAEDLSAYPDNN